jgi:hypothetical protein
MAIALSGVLSVVHPLVPLRWPKLPLVLSATGVAVAVASVAPAAPERSIAGLSAGLGALARGSVAPSDIRWEPSGGALADYVWGRGVLFLAAAAPNAPRDVYRARARVTPEGDVLGAFAVTNLTETPLGDDHALVVDGEHAAFATFVYGQEQTVTWFDLGGDGDAPAEGEGVADRLTDYLTRAEETGSGRGIRRVEVSLAPPARAVGLTLAKGAPDLNIDLAYDEGKRTAATLDGAKGELLTPEPTLHADVVRRLPKRFILWAVDTVRGQVGPAPIAWLEEHVFGVTDALRRATFHPRSGESAGVDTLADPKAAAEPAPPLLDASGAGTGGVAWPPVGIRSIWKTPEPGEGEWQEPRLAWNKGQPARSPDAPPPPFYRTFIRPDPDRPYSRVILVAMDMRQLDLAMEAGTEDPKPLTGGHGPGRIPRDPAVASRVVAAFNGGFKTEHGNYGMMVDKRVLLPPQPNAASVVVLADRRVAFGTWGDTHDVGGIRGVADDDIVSFRQNLDPLVDRGEVNPLGRALWGYTLPGTTMQTERSGMCVTDGGQVIYAWGDDLSGTTLGKALKLAGCSYAMHLDMNPHHTGFIFSKIGELKGHNYKSELLTPLMTVSPDRYIEYAPKDFFYVLMHDGTPPPVDGVAFHPDPGAMPPPAWSPAIWSATLTDKLGPVELTRIDPGRARFRVRAGTKEPDAKTGASPVHELAEADVHNVVMSVGLGYSLDKKPRGLATDGRLSFPMHDMEGSEHGHDVSAALITDADGALALVHARDVTSIGPHVDLAELPLILDGGVVVAESRHASALLERGALGVTADGTVLVARGALPDDVPLAVALKKAGCRRAVALDRGAFAPPSIARVGTASPPRGRTEETTLYVLSAPMKPRAFRFEAGATVARAQ